MGLINFNCGMNYGYIYAIYIKVWGTDGSIILYACHRTSGMASSDTAGTKIHYVLYSVIH